MENDCLFKGTLAICKPGKLQKTERIQKIINASKTRGDQKITEALEKPYENKTLISVLCHKNCISSYISESNLKAFKSRVLVEQEDTKPHKKLRSSSVPFNPKLHCLYHKDICECLLPEECDPKQRAWIQQRNPTSRVMTKLTGDGKEYVDVLLGICDERNDELGEVVRSRLLGIGYDLPAVEARYHISCQRDFNHIDPKSEAKNEKEDVAFQNLVKVLQNDKKKLWNSHELEKEYHQRENYESTKYSRQCLIARLEDHFKGDLITLNGPGIASIVMFKTHGAVSMKLTDDKEDDSQNTIKKSGQNIKFEVKERKQTLDSYQVHIDRYAAAECTSDYLSDILAAVDKNKLCKYSLPSLMVGNVVASQVNSQTTPLQIAFGILLSGQRTIIEALHPYGICCSYNEVRRWLRSAAVLAARDKCWAGMSDEAVGGLIQVIIDNFDAVINSLNCREECHVLAMISTQSRQNQIEESTIPRLTKAQMKEPIDCEPQLIPYTGPKNPPMPIQATAKFEQSEEMKEATRIGLARARELDFQFISEITHRPGSTPEYNGFNTHNCRETLMAPSPKSAARYHPLINSKPAHHDTVNTALQQAIQITQDSNQNYVVMTADLQIYKIIVSILFHQPDLLTYIVALLGRMHMLMDFIAALGTLAKACGLYEILRSTFGSVEKMLEGKKYPQNVRAIRLLAEELLRPILLKHPDITTMEELEAVLDELSAKSKTSKVWIDLTIKPAFIVILYIRADHKGNFALHLYAASLMLVYIFVGHKYNYV